MKSQTFEYSKVGSHSAPPGAAPPSYPSGTMVGSPPLRSVKVCNPPMPNSFCRSLSALAWTREVTKREKAIRDSVIRLGLHTRVQLIIAFLPLSLIHISEPTRLLS